MRLQRYSNSGTKTQSKSTLVSLKVVPNVISIDSDRKMASSRRSPVPPQRQRLGESLSKAILARPKLERKTSDPDILSLDEEEVSVERMGRSPLRSKRQSRRSSRASFASSLFGGGGRPKLEKKNSDRELMEDDDDNYEDDNTVTTGNQTFQDSIELSLGDVEYALESPESQKGRASVMRKRGTLDSLGMASAAKMASDWDRSRDSMGGGRQNNSSDTVRFQNSVDSDFLKPPLDVIESDESMDMVKSNHRPGSRKSRKKSADSEKERRQEIFLLRLSICFLLTGCMFLSMKHFRLMKHVDNGGKVLPRDLTSNGPALGGTNMLKPNPQARIVGGGAAADASQYPWFVLFHGSSICGGAMITADVLITAAHVSRLSRQQMRCFSLSSLNLCFLFSFFTVQRSWSPWKWR